MLTLTQFILHDRIEKSTVMPVFDFILEIGIKHRVYGAFDGFGSRLFIKS